MSAESKSKLTAAQIATNEEFARHEVTIPSGPAHTGSLLHAAADALIELFKACEAVIRQRGTAPLITTVVAEALSYRFMHLQRDVTKINAARARLDALRADHDLALFRPWYEDLEPIVLCLMRLRAIADRVCPGEN